MSDGGTDLADLMPLLVPIEDIARAQRWDAERPWRRKTHLWVENGVVVIDLHDLGAKGSKKVVRAVISLAARQGLHGGAVAFVTGRGRHSRNGPVLKELVVRRLQSALEDHPDWSVHVVGAGRISLVTDPQRAPDVATNTLGWGFWLLVAGLAAAAAWACMGTPGVG